MLAASRLPPLLSISGIGARVGIDASLRAGGSRADSEAQSAESSAVRQLAAGSAGPGAVGDWRVCNGGRGDEQHAALAARTHTALRAGGRPEARARTQPGPAGGAPARILESNLRVSEEAFDCCASELRRTVPAQWVFAVSMNKIDSSL